MSQSKIDFKFGRLFVDSSWISDAKCRHCKKPIQIVRFPNNSKIAIEKKLLSNGFIYHSKYCRNELRRKKYGKKNKTTHNRRTMG